MAVLKLEEMTTSQKLMAMEELWEDMSKNLDDEILTPKWHKTILEEREYQLQNGKTTFENFDTVKEELLKKFA